MRTLGHIAVSIPSRWFTGGVLAMTKTTKTA